MSEKINEEQRSKYVKFRFEDSLRKYEQQPKKKMKISESSIMNLSRNNSKLNLPNRLLRLCQTRKIYNATSREKASQYSRRKSALQENQKKGNQLVSDFNCSVWHPIDQKEKQNNFQYMFSEKVMIPSTQKLLVKSQIKNIENSFRETPIKFKQNEQKSNKSQSIYYYFDDQIKYNKIRFKDIDFHIGLVQQLNYKITNQIKKCQAIFNLNINQNIQYQNQQILSSNYYKQKLKQNTIQLSSEQKKYDKNCILQENKIIKKYQNQIIKHSINYDNSSSGRVWEQTEIQINDQEQQKYKYSLIISQLEDESNDKKTIQRQGRIKIKGLNREYFLSARLFDNICMNQKQPNKIIESVIHHHPELKDAWSSLQILINDSIIN